MLNKTSVLTVTDLHRREVLLRELHEAAGRHRPTIAAFVGDFLHAFDDNKGRVSVADCAQLISNLSADEFIFVRGNHEDEAWWEFANAWNAIGRPLRALHGELFSHGPMTFVGFPCLMGDESPYIGERPPLALDPDEWLPGVILPAGRTARTLWLMHEPPAGTPLSARGSLVEGNPEWVEAIERFSP